MKRPGLVLLLVLGGWFLPGARAKAAESAAPVPEAAREAAPVIELWTMGQGEDIFERFGHGALCVFTEPGADGLCYNYGTTRFKDPLDLARRFLEHRAMFWVSVASSDRTLADYAASDRTIWVQRLPLTDAQSLTLAARLAHDARPENREYLYDHFMDNCTTRLRDHIDVVTGGALHAGSETRYGPTWRDMVRHGFSAEPALLAATEILLGRIMEERPTRWEAMFHPDVLRQVVAERLGVAPEVMAERTGPPLTGPPLEGRVWIIWLAIALATIGGLLAATGVRFLRRLGFVIVGLVLTLLSLVVYALCFHWKIVYLHANEVALVLMPTDVLLCFVGVRTLRTYLSVRLVLLALCAGLVAGGLLSQPLGPVIVLAALPLACLRAALVERPWRAE